MTAVSYDEFGMFPDNAADAGLVFDEVPVVRRVSVAVGPDQQMSALVWGAGDPEIVLVHGGAQNAHTWDTVALAVGRPLVAVDLPGHGHSDWRTDHDYSPERNAEALAVAIPQLAPDAKLVVGMSLGGLSAFHLAARHPELVPALAIVDVTPGVDAAKAKAITDFVRGPESFASFDEILARTIEHNPGRSESSLRRGVLHNARERDDGRWIWRYDMQRGDGTVDMARLWDDVAAIRAPILLLRGDLSPVVDDADVDAFRARQPEVRYELVAGAGHSIQGDQPVVLAGLLDAFVTAVS